MLKLKPNRRKRSALPRCVVLLIAIGALDASVTAAAATFGGAQSDGINEAAILDDIALEALASPIALYPDELLAIVLPAATFPLQIVQAARFLEARQRDATLEPDESWDDTVVALLNYPEALALLDSDLAWTERLGAAVITQEAALMRAISRFRERAYSAGNLRSDDRQQVSRNSEVIEITSAGTDTVYVPYYSPSAVVLPQPRAVYHYYSNPYPLYYYPYSPQHHYLSSAFWGLTTAYTIGWATHRIRFHRHDYSSHPYYHKRYYRPRYRDHAAQWPRSAFAARHRYPRNYHGDAWRNRRFTGRRDAAFRHHTRKPALFARDPHPSDRIRSGHHAKRAPAVARRGSSAVPNAAVGNDCHARTGHRIDANRHRHNAGGRANFRANNGLFGNGTRARPRTLTNPGVRTAAKREPAAARSGANARRSRGAAVASTPTRHGAAKGVVSLQDRARASAAERPRAGNRTARRAAHNAGQSRRAGRTATRGISSDATAASNPRSIGNEYRGTAAGGRTRAGGRGRMRR